MNQNTCELKYPLCRQAGLEWSEGPHYHCITAADVERLLANAPVVYSLHHMWAPDKMDYDTKQARLLLIEPIAKPDTAESLLREYVESYDDSRRGQLPVTLWVARAKKLLGGGK